MIIKHTYRKGNQTRAVYFSGWESSPEYKKISPDYFKGDVNHPFTSWLGAAKILSQTEADEELPKFRKACIEEIGDGFTIIVKENRAKRAGWRG
jgi:hypothetical protein